MDKERWEGFQALTFVIRHSARVDPNPKIGRIYPKEFDYLMKMEDTPNKTDSRKGSS